MIRRGTLVNFGQAIRNLTIIDHSTTFANERTQI